MSNRSSMRARLWPGSFTTGSPMPVARSGELLFLNNIYQTNEWINEWDFLEVGSRTWIFEIFTRGLPRWYSGKESACQCGRPRFDPWIGKIPWRREWKLTPVFLPGESHGQGTLEGYSPRGHKESDAIATNTSLHALLWDAAMIENYWHKHSFYR